MAELKPAAETTRPTPLSEWTLAGVAIGVCLLIVMFAALLAFRNWPDAVANNIIFYLGMTTIILALCLALIVGGMMSPWMGTMKISGLGVNMDLSGDDGAATGGEN